MPTIINIMLCYLSKVVALVSVAVIAMLSARDSFGADGTFARDIQLVLEQKAGSEVRLKIINGKDHDIHWYNYFSTPTGLLRACVFFVFKNGDSLSYTGIQAELVPPEPTSFADLKKGEVYAYTTNLSRYFKLERGSTYKVEARILFSYFTSPKDSFSLKRIQYMDLVSAPLLISL